MKKYQQTYTQVEPEKEKISSLCKTSGFWPRVRARALRAPVFWNSLPRQTGAARPTRPSQLRCFLFDPQK
jgi:hypothetical protein